MLEYKKFNYSYNYFIYNKANSPKNYKELINLSKKKYNTIGNLRSYNDAAIGPNPLNLKYFNKIIKLDLKKKIVVAEGGITLKELITSTLKKKLIIKSLPGSRYITLGGMIANNTQGKYFNKTFIKDHLISLTLIHNSKKINCSMSKNKKLFLSTVGGKGSTGIIISAKLRLEKIPSETIMIEKFYFKNVNDLKKKFLKIKKKEYVLAWLDTFSKNYSGILFSGQHKKKLIYKKDESEISIPFIIIYALNLISSFRFFTFIFNKVFKLINHFNVKEYQNIFNFFFIQDRIKNWNAVFKKNGFIQFQFRCNFKDLNKYLDDLKIIFRKNGIFSNFIIVKFYKKNNKIYNSVSFDIIKSKNFIKNSKVLNKFIMENNLHVSLSKDSIISKINKKTFNCNKFLNYKNFDKNFESFFLKRLLK